MLLMLAACGPHRHTEVTIKGAEFYINGKPTFKGKTWRGMNIQGLLPNARLVNGIFDDKTDSTRYRWAYPDTGVWDAERNTNEFVEHMPQWRDSGLLAFTINLQGGSPQGYSKTQPWYNSGFHPDGSLDENYLSRLTKVLDKADELGMVVILGLYYQGQEKRMDSPQTVKNGIRNAVEWVLKKGYRNVMIEINNECNYYTYDGLSPETVYKSIEYAKSIEYKGRRLLVSTSYGGRKVPGDDVIRVADFILIHGNGISNPDDIFKHIESVRKSPAYTDKPVLYNEDDHYNFNDEVNNFVNATKSYVSWGYFDYRKPGEAFEEGFQCIPADWGLNSERKKGFFSLVNEWGR